MTNRPSSGGFRILRKRDIIISAVKARLKVSTRKYGVEVSTSDKKNGNTLWDDALTKEMTNVSIAFEILEEGESVPVGWSNLSRLDGVNLPDI